jgi:hypothetical protein
MKITINLTDPEVKGIEEYLSSFDGRAVTSFEVIEFIQNVVGATLYNEHEAVRDYIMNQKK